ncbi:MAG: hypothetical protein CVU48_05965 [Candidatus Cloacimonetes bacterium HGW-Cloacimonetes-1]|jgi:DNA polymerase III delta prime subunit|nr:MAG: hypothetical protein CVU48_05965 [Candidatus Cloacimonetes bacterium HGW-Cloacimonetes-1]
MSHFIPIEQMLRRMEREKQDDDVAFFNTLMYLSEMYIKILTVSIASFVSNSPERYRYRIHYRLVRADGIGDWISCFREMLYGPTLQYLDDVAHPYVNIFKDKVTVGLWQYDVVSNIHEVLNNLGFKKEKLGPTTTCYQWFEDFALFRNKTRGHGALTRKQCIDFSKSLEASITKLVEHTSIFELPWAYLHKNYSGKYRVSYISRKTDDFDYLKGNNDESYADGIYLCLEGLRKVDLLYSNVDLSDYWIANGSFKKETFEILSYESNSSKQADNSMYLYPIESFPDSETQGLGSLGVSKNCFSNIPPNKHIYITREKLETDLHEQITLKDRHPIITLSGPGGIGKTTLLINVLSRIMNEESNPFTCMIWFSARDIDLLSVGPKWVKAHLVTKEAFAKEYVNLTSPSEAKQKGFSEIKYFSEHLTNSPIGTTLFVFDNFETVVDQKAVYIWLDTFVRLPNKVLITTRTRDFKADYPLHVKGMNKDEAWQLMDAISLSMPVSNKPLKSIYDEIYSNSNGHPYVIKMLLGECYLANTKEPKKILESKDEMLMALFERTFDNLSPLAKRIYMLLSNWYSIVPVITIEAIYLSTSDTPIDVRSTVDELLHSSFVEEVVSEEDNQAYINVPYVSSIFGKKKLKVSPMKSSVELDSEYLRLFGPVNKTDVSKGIFHKIEKFVNKLAKLIVTEEDFYKHLPVLEILARRVPSIWVLISRLNKEIFENYYEKSKEHFLKYLENPDGIFPIKMIWEDLIQMSFSCKQYKDEIHFLVEVSSLDDADLESISENARRMSNIIKQMKIDGQAIDYDEKKYQIKKLITLLLNFHDEFNADDCSRISWLYSLIGDSVQSEFYADKGLAIDKDHVYCNKVKSFYLPQDYSQ